MVDKKSRILVEVFFAAVILSATAVYIRYMIFKDYEVIITPEPEIEVSE